MKTIRHAAVVGLVIVTAVAMTGCAGNSGDNGSDGAGLTTINIGATHGLDLYGMPWFVAQEQGFFEDNGLTVGRIFSGSSGGTDDLHALSAGEHDIATIAFGASVKGAAAGEDIGVVGGATQAVVDVNYYAESSSDIKTIDDVRRWGYTNPGSTTQSIANVVADRADLDPSAVEFVATGGFGEGVALLEAGDIDVAYVPPAIFLEQKDKYRLVVNTVDYIPAFQQDVIVTTSKYADENPEAVRGAIQAYQEGVDYIYAHPEEVAPILAENSQISEDIALEIVQTAVDNDYWGTAYNAEALGIAAEALASVDDEASEVPWCELFTTEYLPEGATGSLPVTC